MIANEIWDAPAATNIARYNKGRFSRTYDALVPEGNAKNGKFSRWKLINLLNIFSCASMLIKLLIRLCKSAYTASCWSALRVDL